jgi:hypothetical protein
MIYPWVMVFLAPLWLLALVPWAGLAIWAMARSGKSVAVPFVHLWRTEHPSPRKRGLRRPPLAVLLLLGAILLALLAAAGPAVRSHGALTVVVDRGAAMSVDLRYQSSAAAVADKLRSMGLKTNFVAVPAYRGRIDRAQDIPPSAVDTRPLLAGAITEALLTGGAVCVVTDQDLPLIDGRRVFRIAPPVARGQVAITLLAAKTFMPSNGSATRPASPDVAQVMARLRNHSDRSEIALEAQSAGESRQDRVTLPSAGESRDYFVDLPSFGETIHAKVGDRLGQEAWLVRQRGWPAIEALGPVPPAVERVIAAYSIARPASPAALAVVVTTGTLAADARGILVGTGDTAAFESPPTVVDHPLTRQIDWAALCKDASVAGTPPADWQPLVVAGRTLLAIDSTGHRVWVGLQPSAGGQSVDWVILWTRLFDELGATAAEQYQAEAPQQLGQGWTPIAGHIPPGTEAGFWPGLYRYTDGRLRAINAGEIMPANAASSPDWLEHVFQSVQQSAHGPGGRSWSGWLLLASLVLLVTAVWATRLRPRP